MTGNQPIVSFRLTKILNRSSTNRSVRGLVFQLLHLPRLSPTHSNSLQLSTPLPLLTPNLLPKFKFWAKVTLKWSLWHLFDFIFDRKTVWPENIKISIRKYIFFVSKFFHHDSLRIWSPDFFLSNIRHSGNAWAHFLCAASIFLVFLVDVFSNWLTNVLVCHEISMLRRPWWRLRSEGSSKAENLTIKRKNVKKCFFYKTHIRWFLIVFCRPVRHFQNDVDFDPQKKIGGSNSERVVVKKFWYEKYMFSYRNIYIFGSNRFSIKYKVK